jgi:putative tryptophan/tyrosine transport system substrate-binding protein
MKRREFMMLAGGTAAAWPFATRAQKPQKMPRIGYLGAGILAVKPNPRDAFMQGLRELGYVEGQTYTLVERYADGRQERLPELAVELVRLEVDVLVAPTSGAAKAAMDATRTIPIVMAGGGDPVGLGLVASLARPGGNVTGPSMMNTEIIGKRMQLLKEVVPGLTRVAVLANSVNPIHALFRRETEPAARELGLEFQLVEARVPEDFEPAFAAATRGKAGALIALDDALTYNFRSRIVALAAASRLPALYGYREFPDVGGLMSYGANMASHYRLAAAYVDKILRGAKPGDLPVEQPTKFELVVNFKTAKTLGLELSSTLLSRADEVIEE